MSESGQSRRGVRGAWQQWSESRQSCSDAKCHKGRSAGYAGKKQEVKVHHDEGVANHIDPESCAVTREGLGEALTGERIGQPSSRGRGIISGADAVLFAEGETEGCVNRECPEDPAWSETLACA